MKVNSKKIKNILIVAFLIVLTSGISVYAGTQIAASSIAYTKAGRSVENVEQALNDLYDIKSNYILPSGNKVITANGTGIDVRDKATVDVNVSTAGTATAGDIYSGKTAWVNGQQITGTATGIKAYVLGNITAYGPSDSTNWAAFGNSSDTNYFTCSGNKQQNYLTITAKKDMNITIVLQDSGRGDSFNRIIDINNTTVSTLSMGMTDIKSYSTSVSKNDVIKITANRPTSSNVRATAVFVYCEE